jgi:hypothetical protein
MKEYSYQAARLLCLCASCGDIPLGGTDVLCSLLFGCNGLLLE